MIVFENDVIVFENDIIVFDRFEQNDIVFENDIIWDVRQLVRDEFCPSET